MQLPENEENIVEDQPTEAVDSDADDNENQEDFSEEIEDEDTESSLENEDYPGEDVVEIINLLHYLARSSHVVVSPVYTAFT